MYSLAHFLSHLRRSEVSLVLDAGANAGQFASELFNAGFGGRVISFEPLSTAHALLTAAARANPSWEVAPRCALGAKAGSAVINISGNSYSSSLRPMLERHLSAAPESAYIGTESTPVETLAGFIARRFPGGVPPFALKIDTQGFESEVLDGLDTHINQCSAILLEMPLDPLYGGAADLPSLFSRLIKCNFHCVGLSPGHKDNRSRDAIEVDGLFVRDVSVRQTAISLFTSIPPSLSGGALAQQRDIISSWRAAGFQPISVNGPSEAKKLAEAGLDIEIETISEDGKPFISDILTAIQRTECKHAGIINSDCRLVVYPDLALTLAAAVENGVLYAERLEMKGNSAPVVGNCMGFDFFVFDVGVLDTTIDRNFRFGETWWDYWFPLQLAANGATLGNINLPVILHRVHKSVWSEDQWLQNGRQLFGKLKTWSRQSKSLPFRSVLNCMPRLETPDLQDLRKIGAECFEWLRSRTSPREITFLPKDLHGIEAFLRDMYQSYSELAELKTLKTELAVLEPELAAAKTELAAVKAELAAIKTSTWWRATLRYVVDRWS